MSDLWDEVADLMTRGDKKREIAPLPGKTWKDGDGFTHYVFNKAMFKNPKYTIPTDDQTLFDKFLDGGSRSYPSDGSVPTDIVAREARPIIHQIEGIAKNRNHRYYEDAKDALKGGKFSIVRGTMKLYLGKFTTRDWRRKRFTDDIDFWIHKIGLYEHVLKNNGWNRDPKTKEFKKTITWQDPFTNKRRTDTLYAANNINLQLDFGGGEFLKGAGLKNIFAKKIKRGHDVDLSDIINVAMVHNKASGYNTNTWKNAWEAFEEAANTRGTRIISNMISLSRHAHAIADYTEHVGSVLIHKHELIFHMKRYSNEDLKHFCKVSIYWQKYLKTHGPDLTRELIHDYIFEQGYHKRYYARNLRDFAGRILKLVNAKLSMFKIIIEIE